jgi:undecaprenyl diphosphate synthase
MREHASIPTHLGFIIDGNRRWAKAQGLSPQEGHAAGYRVLKDVLIDVLDRGVRYVSVYIFSTENWNRDPTEVRHLMQLFLKVLRDDAELFIEHRVRVRVLGSRERLGKFLRRAIDDIEERTRMLDGGQLLLCLNYGGQQEITNAVNSMLAQGVGRGEVTPALLEQFLYTPDIPPCDMIVRTGGERRLSNFMLWRSAYSELMFIRKYWPEMTKHDVTRILSEYARRTRRFGG